MGWVIVQSFSLHLQYYLPPTSDSPLSTRLSYATPQTRTVRSSLPLTIICLSALTATAVTRLVCPCKLHSSRPVPRCQILMTFWLLLIRCRSLVRVTDAIARSEPFSGRIC